MTLHPDIHAVTQRIIERSAHSRQHYLSRMQQARKNGPSRSHVSCGNLAHSYAACEPADKSVLAVDKSANLAIINSYNDILSAHQSYEHYPKIIKQAARDVGAVAQVAGGVPAMCDGVTQGQAGMELSLFSRDVIAMATAIALSHDVFDGVACLGVCDKIVPGLLIGALSFGHLPTVFIPAGPMPTGLANSEKQRVRQLYAEGKVDRDALLKAESASYHSAGTCTFYGTANSNQMLMEIMGLHLPGSSFVPPNTVLRDALTKAATQLLVSRTAMTNEYLPLCEIVSEKTLVNGLIGLLATGGSTNHTLHIVAIARAAGIIITWQDMADLSKVIPLLCRIYPNGEADVNHFHAAGGMGFLIRELRAAGLLHRDVKTIMKDGLDAYCKQPTLKNGELAFASIPQKSGDESVLTGTAKPFSQQGGLKVLSGNIGQCVMKISAVKTEHQLVTAPAVVVTSQQALQDKFNNNELERDFIAVVRFQGPKANGMPELHKLTPALGVLQDRGFKVALITDGRMSGASGKVPAAIHLCPEALDGGMIAKIKDGDMITLDSSKGTLNLHVEPSVLNDRVADIGNVHENQWGMGRELFAPLRAGVGGAQSGASVFTTGFDALDNQKIDNK